MQVYNYLFKIYMSNGIVEFIGGLSDIKNLKKSLMKRKIFYKSTEKQIFIIQTNDISYVKIVPQI